MITTQINKRFGGRSGRGFALDVEFTAGDGITVIAGASGAGKSTLLHCLAGLVTPDDGEIVIQGRRVFDAGHRIDIPPHRRRVALVFQDLALFPHLRVDQNVAYGLRHLNRRERARRLDQGLTMMRIAELVRRPVGTLSGGQRQRVALARSLVTHPDILLLDEALSSLDWPTKQVIIEDLKAWNQEIGTPLLHITHDPLEAALLSDRAVVLADGRLKADGHPDDVMAGGSRVHGSDT